LLWLAVVHPAVMYPIGRAQVELRQLRYFAAVARKQSFGKAAAELRIAQPALSRQIALLESELGVKLFERHARGARPTKEAEFLLERVEFGLNYFEQTRRDLLAQQHRVFGPVVIGLQDASAEVLGPPLIEECRRTYPEVQIRIIGGLSPALREHLIRGEADMALLTETVEAEKLSIMRFSTAQLCLIGAPGSLADGKAPIRMAELAGLPMILAGLAHLGVRRVVEQAAGRTGVAFDVVAEVDSIIVARKMVTRGLGYTIGLRRNAQAEIDRELLAARPIRGLYLTLFLCRALMFAPSRAVHEVQRTLVRIAKDAWRDAD
jgi:LysR family transcriptional regulator, nitrogen assimilation regulatory protein